MLNEGVIGTRGEKPKILLRLALLSSSKLIRPSCSDGHSRLRILEVKEEERDGASRRRSACGFCVPGEASSSTTACLLGLSVRSPLTRSVSQSVKASHSLPMTVGPSDPRPSVPSCPFAAVPLRARQGRMKTAAGAGRKRTKQTGAGPGLELWRHWSSQSTTWRGKRLERQRRRRRTTDEGDGRRGQKDMENR